MSLDVGVSVVESVGQDHGVVEVFGGICGAASSYIYLLCSTGGRAAGNPLPTTSSGTVELTRAATYQLFMWV